MEEGKDVERDEGPQFENVSRDHDVSLGGNQSGKLGDYLSSLATTSHRTSSAVSGISDQVPPVRRGGWTHA